MTFIIQRNRKLLSFLVSMIFVISAMAIPSTVMATNHPDWHWETYWNSHFQGYQYRVVDNRCSDGEPDSFRVVVYSGKNYTDHQGVFCGYVDLLSDFSIVPNGASWNDNIQSACVTHLPAGKVLQFAEHRDQQGAKDRWFGVQCWPDLGEFDKRYSSFKRITP